MGTAVSMIAFIGSRAVIASIGDSRIYNLSSGKLTQITKDHTLVQELVDSGSINESEAKTHPIAHMLTRSLGPIEKIEAQYFEQEVVEGDRYLICSDGLYNHVSDEEIEEMINTKGPKEACDSLLSICLLYTSPSPRDATLSRMPSSA